MAAHQLISRRRRSGARSRINFHKCRKFFFSNSNLPFLSPRSTKNGILKANRYHGASTATVLFLCDRSFFSRLQRRDCDTSTSSDKCSVLLCSGIISIHYFFYSPLQITKAPPTSKYCSLCFFESRFLPHMESVNEAEGRAILRSVKINLYPLTIGNLQMLALVSFWIASKIHETKAVSLNQLKMMSSSLITDQHFTKKDFVEAEIILMKAINFDLRTGPLVFSAMDDLLVKFRQTARVGKLVKLQSCVNIIDLLYDFDPKDLNLRDIPIDKMSSAILVVAFILCVPIEKFNFPLLPWCISTSKIRENEIIDLTKRIFRGIVEERSEGPASDIDAEFGEEGPCEHVVGVSLEEVISDFDISRNDGFFN